MITTRPWAEVVVAEHPATGCRGRAVELLHQHADRQAVAEQQLATHVPGRAIIVHARIVGGCPRCDGTVLIHEESADRLRDARHGEGEAGIAEIRGRTACHGELCGTGIEQRSARAHSHPVALARGHEGDAVSGAEVERACLHLLAVTDYLHQWARSVTRLLAREHAIVLVPECLIEERHGVLSSERGDLRDGQLRLERHRSDELALGREDLGVAKEHRHQLRIAYAIENRGAAEVVYAELPRPGVREVEGRVEHPVGDVRAADAAGSGGRLRINRRVHGHERVVDILAPAALVAADVMIPAGHVDQVLRMTARESVEVLVSDARICSRRT